MLFDPSPRLSLALKTLANSLTESALSAGHPTSHSKAHSVCFSSLSLNVSLLGFAYKRIILNYHKSLKSYLFQKIIFLIYNSWLTPIDKENIQKQEPHSYGIEIKVICSNFQNQLAIWYRHEKSSCILCRTFFKRTVNERLGLHWRWLMPLF